MEAEGSAQNSAAQDVLMNCIKPQSVGLIELITPKVRIRVAAPVRIYRRTLFNTKSWMGAQDSASMSMH